MSVFWKRIHIPVVLGTFFALSPAAVAQCSFDSGSDGTDGDLVLTVDTEINLSLATTGPWDTTNGGGNGVYDPTLWAVVFKYKEINLTGGVDVTFKNHPSGAPVVWLAQGNVTISGGATVHLNGADGVPNNSLPPGFSEPGPGGFQGGQFAGAPAAALPASGGLGPGGAGVGGPGAQAAGGGYADHGEAGGGIGGVPYGNIWISPLIGGSGGSGGGVATTGGGAGGAGGGAITIASSGDIILNGAIEANGGRGTDTAAGGDGGGGSGGAMRLIANTIQGTGEFLQAKGGVSLGSAGDGSDGRIRIEACVPGLSAMSDPVWEESPPGEVFPCACAPTLKVVSIGGESAPDDPLAGILTPDVFINTGGTVSVEIELTNVAPKTTVTVRVVQFHGVVIEVTSEALEAKCNATSTVFVDIPDYPIGTSELQVRADWAPGACPCPCP